MTLLQSDLATTTDEESNHYYFSDDGEFSMASESLSEEEEDTDFVTQTSSFEPLQSQLGKRKSKEQCDRCPIQSSFELVTSNCSINDPKSFASDDLTSFVKRRRLHYAILAFFKEHNVPLEAVDDPLFHQLLHAIRQVKR